MQAPEPPVDMVDHQIHISDQAVNVDILCGFDTTTRECTRQNSLDVVVGVCLQHEGLPGLREVAATKSLARRCRFIPRPPSRP